MSNAPRPIPRLLCQISSLTKLGITTDVLCWQRRKGAVESEKIGCRVEQICLPAPKGKPFLIFCMPLLWFLMVKKVLRHSFNVIHCTHLGLLPMAVFLGKIKKAKVVYDDYDFDSFRITEMMVPPLKPLGKIIAMGIEKIFLRHVDHIFVIDTAGDTLLQHYRRYTPNVTSIANYPILNQNAFSGTKEIPTNLRKVLGDKTLIYVGGIEIAKGWNVLLESLNLVRNEIPAVNLVILGDFSDQKQKEQFDHTVKKYELSSHVQVLGWLPYEQMIQYIRASQIGMALYQPNPRYRLSKGNARKIYTYMSCGIPVIGPEFGEIGTILVKEKCGLVVDTTNSRLVADAILFLLTHPEELNRMGKNGLEAVTKRYNWENESKKFIAAYRTLLDQLT